MADLRWTFPLLAATCLAASATTGESSAATITNVADILRSLDCGAVTSRAFAVEGVITAYDPAGFVITEGSGRYAMRDNENHFRWKLGDRVRASGTIFRSAADRNPRAIVEDLVVIGHVTPPSPEHIPPESISYGEFDYLRATLSGVVIAVLPDEIDSRWSWLFLKTASATIKVCVQNHSFANMRLSDLVDAEVTLTGTVLPPRGWRKLIGSRVYVESPSDVAVNSQPPADPFAESREFGPVDTASWQQINNPHRQKTRGLVVATWGRDTFLLYSVNGDRIFVHLSAGEPLPRPSDTVAIVGFPGSDTFSPHFYETRTRPVRLQEQVVVPPPVAICDKDIFSDGAGNRRINVTLNGRIVRISGIVREVPDDNAHEATMHVKCGGSMLPVNVDNVTRDRLPGIGDEVELTGVCWMQFAPLNRATDFTRLSNVSVVLRSEDDIRLVRRAAILTPFRFIAIITAMVLALLAVAIWNRMLSRIVTRRSRELLKETIARASADLKVGERTRLAVELHDSVAQDLIGVSLQIAAAQRTQASNPEASQRHLAIANNILQSCRTELRQCLWDLRSAAFEDPNFEHAVQQTVTPVLAGAELTVRFGVPRSRLHDNTAQAVLRILRELVSNAVRHGKASRVRIEGELQDDGIRFSVVDNGCGFDPLHCFGPEDGHFGLKGIRERLVQSNGNLSIESAPGKGTRAVVTMTFPDSRRSMSETR
ncbi:MAG: sensor histidine kinase [Kiritimatiellae bacterium]|nr:sensor histidine kinase [Kiritimatiellia bacterium]